MAVIEDDSRWQAVLDRDTETAGSFVYGVRSTGVYCRPTCASRRPARRQVVFFPEPAAAEQAGFRPCRRCRPREDRQTLVERVCRVIEAHADESLTLEELGRRVEVSPYHLQREFKRVTGVTPRQYGDALRLERFKSGLKQGTSVTTALYDAGYGSSSRLYERVPGRLGMTPSTYRRGGTGMEIGYAVVPCRLGKLLVAGTERGISAVYLGDSDEALVDQLRREFPRARLEARTDLHAWVDPLMRHLDGQQPTLDLPLDVQATAFQLRVWQALLAIPYGSTRTYREVAEIVGAPTAARAVARACATNPASVVIPCHRVVRGDGGLGGYRWGLDRKRALQEQERHASTEQSRRQ